MSDKITVPAELRDKLAGANGHPIPLCDETGTLVGYFLSPTGFAALQSERAPAHELASEAELDAAEARGGSRSMDEVLKLLGPR